MAAEKLSGGYLLADLLSNFVPVGIFGGAVPVFGGGSFQFFFESLWINGLHYRGKGLVPVRPQIEE